MSRRGTESDFELTTIERLERQNYRHIHGEEIERPHEEVVLKDALREQLQRRYPELPDRSIEEAVSRFSRPQGVDLLRRNLAFHIDLIRGIDVKVEWPDGRVEYRHLHAIDWDNSESNDFLVVNQLPVHGQNDRRTDIIVYVNGLPLVLFELKNPFDEHPTVYDALNQIGHYRNEIPQVFEFNAITVISDGVTTLHGMWTSTIEWYAPWKSIDGLHLEANTTGSMKTLIEGLFLKDRLLSYIRNFIVFEVANDKVEKKGAKYHQFFAVRLAAQKAIEAVTAETEKRIGVIWHTTGSGKSLSMAFLVGILRRDARLNNPTFVIQVDRNDLDDQLHDQFVAARALVGDVKHAESVDDLRDLLNTEVGEIIFTTIEKFQLKRDQDGEQEIRHPVLSTRSNIIVIADEAHRSQYGFLKGFARYLAEALPNARRLGFTGTPVSFGGADTIEVFGDLIHTYDIKQSQEDGATVPIYYSPRQIKLHLNHRDVDAALEEIAHGEEIDDLERKKGRWAALAGAAAARDRMGHLAQDLLDHYRDRNQTLNGKALIVCMTRAHCVRLHQALAALRDCPEVKIVMTANLAIDPEEWSRKGYYTTKAQRDTIKQRMIDPDDPLRMVIVCDMWLTGTDIPCLHTLYVDKPMKGHNVIQAISRVNRIFRNKPHGLIVDYIGIGEELREATGRYTQGGGHGEPAPDVESEAKPLFYQCINAVRAHMPESIDYGDWRGISRIDYEDRCSLVYGQLTESDEKRESYLEAETRLTMTFLLVKHLDECRAYADEIIFYQHVRNQLGKIEHGKKPQRDLETAVRDLVDESIESEGVVDIFRVAGIDKADVSILDDQFLQTYKDKPLENLRLKLLEKILQDEIQTRQRKNLAKAKSFKELLEKTLQKYHNRLIDAASVIQAMIEIRKDMENSDRRAKELGLNPEELAFYDAVAENYATIYDQQFLTELIREVVDNIRRNLKVDWTAPHREDVKADVRAAVKNVLRRRNIKKEDFDVLLAHIMSQAEALYGNWPTAA